MRAALSLALLQPACSERFNAGKDPLTEDGGSGDGGTPLGADLPPVDEDLDITGCEEVSGSALPGAAVYFIGTYAQGSDGWQGWEEVRLFANQTWRDNGGADCSLVWTVSASEAGTGSCGNCDLGLAVSAVMDIGATTCDEEHREGEESFSTTYGIDLVDDSTHSVWYFAETGNAFGQGNALAEGSSPQAMNFVSSKTCWWF